MSYDIELWVKDYVTSGDTRNWRDGSDVAGGELGLDLGGKSEKEIDCDALNNTFLP